MFAFGAPSITTSTLVTLRPRKSPTSLAKAERDIKITASMHTTTGVTARSAIRHKFTLLSLDFKTFSSVLRRSPAHHVHCEIRPPRIYCSIDIQRAQLDR